MVAVFTYSDVAHLPSVEQRLRAGLNCCLERISSGVYEVVSLCAVSEHRPFGYFVDDPSTLRPPVTGIASGRNHDPLWRRYVRDRHLAWIRAHGSIRAEDVVSHRSAALVHGVPYIGPEPGRIELVNPVASRSGRSIHRRQRTIPEAHTMRLVDIPGPSSASVIPATSSSAPLHLQHKSITLDAPVSAADGLRITTPARTAVDLAKDCGIQSGVAALDSYLAHGELAGGPKNRFTAFPPAEDVVAVRRETLSSIIEIAGRGPGRRRLLTAVDWATGLAESPAESLATVGFRHLGITDVQQQAWIHDAAGTRVGRVDFLIERARVVIEIDGMEKYASRIDPNLMQRDVLMAEKEREHRIRRCGYTVIRLTWADVIDLQRFRRALQRVGLV